MALALAGVAAAVLPGCDLRPGPDLRPDSLLQVELGLSDTARVYRVAVSGGPGERLDPPVVELPPGAWLEFVTQDWWVHEIRFEADSLGPEARAFMERTDQLASPPLVTKDERFVLSFAGAPAARYPFVVEGNGAAARGVVIVGSKR